MWMDNIPRFIVIDDDTLANMITEKMIRIYEPGALVETFADAGAALAAMSGLDGTGTPRAIVLLDINMPGLSGWQFLDAFEATGGCVHDQYRVYMLSSSIDNRDKDRASLYPCVAGMLGKPLTPESIRMVVRKEL